VQRVLQIVGLGVFAAVGLWMLIFMFWAFVGVPHQVRAEAQRNMARLPEGLPAPAPPPPFALQKSPPRIFWGSATTVKFVHNLNTMMPTIDCFDANGNLFYVGSIQILDPNTVLITIAVPMADGAWCGAK
jgi:hypothetical protein